MSDERQQFTDEKNLARHTVLFIPGFHDDETRMSVYELARVLRDKWKAKDDKAEDEAAMRLLIDGEAQVDIYQLEWSRFVDPFSKQELADRIRRAIALFGSWFLFL